MKKIKSSNINHIEYDPKTQILKITFGSGSCYSYDKVPEYAHNQLMASKSKGEHFHQYIKGVYKHKKH